MGELRISEKHTASPVLPLLFSVLFIPFYPLPHTCSHYTANFLEKFPGKLGRPEKCEGEKSNFRKRAVAKGVRRERIVHTGQPS